MKNCNKLIKRVIIFILPVLLMLFLAEITYRNIPNDYSYKSDFIKKQGEATDILILGSSHAYRGVDPKEFDRNCFNFAMVSQTLEYDKAILEIYGQYMPNLKYVLIPISYFSLRSDLDRGVEFWRKYHYSIYTDVRILNSKDKLSLKPYVSITTTNGKNIVKRLAKYYLFGKDNVMCDESGWSAWPTDNKRDLEKAAHTAALRHEDFSMDFSKNIMLLNDIIEKCRVMDYRLILFTPPATQYYVNELNPDKWALIDKTCDSLSLHHENVYYVNYIQDEDFDVTMFGDGDHLNSNGARLLSEKLNRIILNCDKADQLDNY